MSILNQMFKRAQNIGVLKSIPDMPSLSVINTPRQSYFNEELNKINRELERLYEKYTTKMTDFYDALANKVKELGKLAKYLFMSKYVEVAVFWIVAILAFLLWGEL